MIITDKNKNILYRKWVAGNTKEVFLLVHGLGGHSERWEEFAKFFLSYGISSYAIELRGFGETPELKGHIPSFEQYYGDILALCQVIRNENPDKKIFLAGESLGGLLAFKISCRYWDFFSGLACIAPVFSDRLKASLLEYLRVFFALFFNPRRQFIVPLDAAMLTRDPVYQEKLDTDSREHRFVTSRMIFNIFALQAQTRFSKNTIKLPVLFLLAGDDRVVKNSAGRKVFERLQSEDKTIIEYPGARHALSIDSDRDKMFKDILEWVRQRLKDEG